MLVDAPDGPHSSGRHRPVYTPGKIHEMWYLLNASDVIVFRFLTFARFGSSCSGRP